MAFERGEGSGFGSNRFVSKGISEILKNRPSFSDKSSDLQPQPYQDELRKIHAMKLMEKLKEAKLKSEGRMMKEFIPPKSSNNSETEGKTKASFDLTEKKEWMSSVHLWSIPVEYGDNYVAPNQYQQEQGSGLFKGESAGAFVPFKKQPGSGLFKGGSAGAFVPFKKQPGVTIMDCNEESDNVTQVEQIDHVVVRAGNEGKNGAAIPRTPKRQRRCWTPELHGLFVDALDQIGGAEAATPKHILEHMQVEGLTTDEVKSHLQKFRIHIRKLAAAITENYMDGMEQNEANEV